MIEVPPAIVVLGLITGLTYGLLATGLILVYRTSGVINFAQGNIGSLAAAIMGRLSLTLGLPWLAVFPVALASGAAAGAAIDAGVMRRLRRAPRIMAVVATLGAAELLLGLSGSITHIRNTALFPPPFNLTFEVGALVITPYYVLILILSPLIVAGLALFLNPPEWLPRRFRSRYGPAMRAAAENPEAARTAGISTFAMSAVAWAIAGALAAFSGVLLAPARGFQTIDALGPEFLVRGLAPAVLAGMTRLPTALVAGAAIGVIEQVLIWNFQTARSVEGLLFLIILAGLLLRRRSGESATDSTWLSVPVDRVLPERLTAVWSIRNLGRLAALAAVVAALLLPLLISNATAAIFVSIFTLAMVGLSVTVVTGISGQISLGQFALAGIGAIGVYLLFIRRGLPWLPSVLGGALIAAVASGVIGLPALRLRGLLLAVTSLAFGVMAPFSLFAREWAFGTGVDPGRPVIAGREVIKLRSYYYLALAGLVLCMWLVHNLKKGGLGRALRAVRDAEDGARAFGIGATPRKLQAFALAGFLAGLGGVLYGQVLSRLSIDTFPAQRSVSIVVMTVIGGLSSLTGALFGAGYLVGLPAFVPVSAAQLMVSGAGVLVLVLYFPGGLSQMLEPVRLRVIDLLARRSGVDPQEPEEEPDRVVRIRIGRPSTSPASSSALLVAENLVVSYGQVKALDGMSLSVRGGETLGIIGPNGSGKTTLFKVISGFTRPDSGQVRFDGRDLARRSPESRARLGLVRSFQDSLLFPTLTVLDSVRLALELRDPTRFLPSLLMFPTATKAEMKKDERGRELVSLLGLDGFRNKLVGELSTGTRRISELCCLLALEPRLLLLDEPSSGIAQKETEALGELLSRIKATLETTLVVIEHDMPLIMDISDRIIAMASGRSIAEGTPQQIQANEAVIDSYLGTSPVAIARSG